MQFSIFRLRHFTGEMGKLPTSKDAYINTVYTTNDYSIAYYNHISRGLLNDMVPVSNKKIFTLSTTAYSAKHSCLLRFANEYIEQLLAHGLVAKWSNDHSSLKQGKTTHERAPEVLTLNQILGIFYICMGLYAMAIVIFAMELFSHFMQYKISRNE